MISWDEYENVLAYREILLREGADNSDEHAALAANLRRALNEELTPRQRQMIVRYYINGEKMTAIAHELSLNVSTVSRTISRGRHRLRRCLRYGAKELLRN